MTIQTNTGPRTVWRFPIMATGPVTIEVGTDPRIVAAANDLQGAPAVWIEHTLGEHHELLAFQLVPTGAAVPDGAVHLGMASVPTTDGSRMMVHLYRLLTDVACPDTVPDDL